MRTAVEIKTRWDQASVDPRRRFEAGQLAAFLPYRVIANTIDPPLQQAVYRDSGLPLDQAVVRERLVALAQEMKQLIQNDRTRLIRRRFTGLLALLWLEGESTICDSIRDRDTFDLDCLRRVCEWLGVDITRTDTNDATVG